MSNASWPSQRRINIHDLQVAKDRSEPWAMLTSYDAMTASVFEDAGIRALLVGDTAGMVVFGHDTTIPVTVDELIPLVAAVARGTKRALVVADLPFGSYQEGPQQAVATGTRFFKEAGAHALKLEGGARVAPQIAALAQAGMPVMGHVGLTPQSVHALGGVTKVQGRGEAGDRLVEDALALQDAGAFAVVLEAIPSELGSRVTKELTIPVVGIGAGPDCDAQVLVWQDMAGLTSGRLPRFVKQYADLRSVLSDAVGHYVTDVQDGTFPGPDNSYE